MHVQLHVTCITEDMLIMSAWCQVNMGKPGDTFALIFSAEDPAGDQLSGMGVQVSCMPHLMTACPLPDKL